MTGAKRLAWVAATLLVAAACSHTTPYFREAGRMPETPTGVLFRLLLIGDAGEPQPNEPVLDSLQAWTRAAPADTRVVVLGDNVYPAGIPADDPEEAHRRLRQQLAAAGEADPLFLAGNHDWDREGPDGLQALIRQEEFVTPEAAFLPRAGCPGPVVEPLPKTGSPIARLVVLDTQWWLHEHEKGHDCPHLTPDAVVDGLTQALDTPLPVVVVAHHPLATHGPHGGFYDWQDHLFPATRLASWLWVPLPGVGSLYPLFRWHVIRSDQDLVGTANREMRAALERAFAAAGPDTGPVIYVAGHEHGLQVMEGTVTDFVLVSGLGSSTKATPVSHGDDTLFAHEHAGFMALDFTSEAIWLSVVEPTDGGDDVVARMRLEPRDDRR